MQLDWSTLVLEVVNFLVLVWILKRFLYKPVLRVVGDRKAAIDKTLASAKVQQEDAHKLEQQYQSRLADWEREKDGLRRNVSEELQAEKQRLTDDLHAAIAQEREKEVVLAKRRLAELERQAADQGLQQGAQFTAQLMERFAGPELEARLIAVAVEDLPHLPEPQREALRSASHGIKISSAFPLADAQRTALTQALTTAAGQPVEATFAEDHDLLAGVRIAAGPWTVRANLRDELSYFAERIRDESQPQ